MTTSLTTIPAARPGLTRAELETRLLPLHIDFDKYPLVVAGLRGYAAAASGGAFQNQRDVYDDAICLYAPQLDLFAAFNGNTDPSKRQPGSGTGADKGIAVLNPGVWYAHQFAIHGGKQFQYEAICQRAAPVTVTRDGDPPYADSGRFGINIHRGGYHTTSSEGCQTLPPGQWDEFIGKATNAAHQLFGDAWRQRIVAYALIDEGSANVFAPPAPLPPLPAAGQAAAAPTATDAAPTLTPGGFRDAVIRPTLQAMGFWSAPAEQLLLGTALAESGLRERVQRGNGPARGLFQMEPNTHDDIWDNYLKYKPMLAAVVRSFAPGAGVKPAAEVMTRNDAYACAMARAHYLRVSERLPAGGDLASLAHYWKQHYNTAGGGGTEDHFLQACKGVLV